MCCMIRVPSEETSIGGGSTPRPSEPGFLSFISIYSCWGKIVGQPLLVSRLAGLVIIVLPEMVAVGYHQD
jgi:hypothetical protein